MLREARPVPQEDSTSEVHTNSEEIQQSTTHGNVVETTGTLSQPTEGSGIAAKQNLTPNGDVAQTSQLVPPGPTINQQEVLHEPMAPKPADDRLFTWAAFGLTLAIVVLLLKKFLKANGYGAVFMNES